jgi:hypothetical protein
MLKNKVFVQIGTNDGDDEFNELVKVYSPSNTERVPGFIITFE